MTFIPKETNKHCFKACDKINVDNGLCDCINQINKSNMELNEHFLFMSFRYALGRMTYVVSEVVEMIIFKWDEISPNIKLLIHKEINEAIDKGCAGFDIDVEQWQRVLKLPQPPKED